MSASLDRTSPEVINCVTATAERASVVAFLRAQAARIRELIAEAKAEQPGVSNSYPIYGLTCRERALTSAADRIEQGEHTR